MIVPKELRYTKTHEWVRLEQGLAVVGITDFAQHQLSDLTYVELPAVGEKVATEDEVAVVESVKAAADIYAPMEGTIVAVNDALTNTPEVINSDPYGAGWIYKLKPDNKADYEMLLDAAMYEEMMPETDE